MLFTGIILNSLHNDKETDTGKSNHRNIKYGQKEKKQRNKEGRKEGKEGGTGKI